MKNGKQRNTYASHVLCSCTKNGSNKRYDNNTVLVTFFVILDSLYFFPFTAYDPIISLTKAAFVYRHENVYSQQMCTAVLLSSCILYSSHIILPWSQEPKSQLSICINEQKK